MRKLLVVAVATTCLICSGFVFASPASEAASVDGVVLRYTDWHGEHGDDTTNAALASFMEANPGVVVDRSYIPNEQYMEKMNALLAAGNLPDAALFADPSTIEWGLAGRLLDLSDLFTGVHEKMPHISYITPDGKLLAVAGAVEIQIIYYNRDIFDDAGLPYPPASAGEAWSWDEFLQVAKQLTIDVNGNNALSSDFDPNNIDRYGFSMPLWFMPVMTYMYSNEGSLFSLDFSEVTVGDDAALEAVDRLADLMHVHHVMPKFGGSVAYGTDTGLLSGKVAMAMDGQWALENLNILRREEGLRFGIGVLASMRVPVTSAIGGPIVAFSTTEHPVEAKKLVQFIMDPAQTPSYIQGGLWQPNEKRYYHEPELISWWIDNDNHPPEYRSAVLDYTLTSVPRVLPIYRIAGFNPFWDILNPALEQVWLGEKSAAEAIAEALPELEAYHVENIVPQNPLSAELR